MTRGFTEQSVHRGNIGHAPPDLIGCDPCMQKLRAQIATVASHGCTVLISGESGTGKELVARHIHLAGPRADGPFVVADCTALPDTLIASQLFGHVKGAFTDAKQSTLGLFRAASGGTLLIDEIGEMPLHTQATLLRCIQEHSVLPVGAVNPVQVDVQILAATHRNLRDMVAHGQFREDLYYRLDVVRVEVPPLRDHRDDIAPLTEHFLEQQAALHGTPVRTMSAEVKTSLKSYAWPGNVRELMNAIERIVTLSENDYVTVADLPERMRSVATNRNPNESHIHRDIEPLHVVERRLIEQALRATNGNQSRAAQLLGVERHRLSRMIRRFGLQALIKSLRSSAFVVRTATGGWQVSPASDVDRDRSAQPWTAAC